MTTSHTTVVAGGAKPAIGSFERYLTIWVALCISVGILLGQAWATLITSVAL